MYDASNRKDIRKAEKDARQAEITRINYLQAAMSHWQGRQWFYDLLEFCHCFNDPFTGEALTEAYRKGERNVGLRIFADIVAHCPDDYIKMVKEENGRRTESATERSRSEDADRGDQGPTDHDHYDSDPDE